jgi:membrane-bound acyltransferase YfiQ involved in biofilm formation
MYNTSFKTYYCILKLKTSSAKYVIVNKRIEITGTANYVTLIIICSLCLSECLLLRNYRSKVPLGTIRQHGMCDELSEFSVSYQCAGARS